MPPDSDQPIIRRSTEMTRRPARRPGFFERRLLTPDESAHQNLVLIDAEQDAEVELHLVQNSETFFVLQGTLEIIGESYRKSAGPGDLCHFQPGVAHGVRIAAGPARFLVVFAPAIAPRV